MNLVRFKGCCLDIRIRGDIVEFKVITKIFDPVPVLLNECVSLFLNENSFQYHGMDLMCTEFDTEFDYSDGVRITIMSFIKK